MPTENAQSRPEQTAAEAEQRHWTHYWPVLIPLVLVGGLLWVSLWFSRRAEMLDNAGFVEFEVPTWGWLEDVAGREVRTIFASPTNLHISRERPTATQLRMISGFDELTDFSAGGFTDDDLESLADCTKLKWLHLEATSLSDAGCEVLAGFPELESLWISTSQTLSGSGIAAIASLPHLEVLSITSRGMDADILRTLADVKSLERLSLDGITIHGDELKFLTRLNRLSGLGLTNSDIGETSLAALQPSLSGPNLYLTGSNITDRHLQSVQSLTWLKTVSLEETEVTRVACDALHRARPGMTIFTVTGDVIRSNSTAATTPPQPPAGGSE